MFGDDPDSSVTTTRFGFGAVFGHAKRGGELAREVRWSGSRGKQKPDWSRNSQLKQGVTRQLRADTGFMKTYGCDAHDAMR